MTQTNLDVDKILSNPSFRNVVHLLGTFIFGYILVRLLLLFLDAIHIGSSWLQTHQNGGLTIIIFILIFSLLVLDLAISMGRRHYDDEKYSIVEVGVSYVKEKTAGINSRSIEPDTGLTKSDVSSLSGMIGTVEKDEFMKKPRMSHISNLSERIDTGVSFIKEKTARSSKPETKSETSSLSDMVGTVEKDEFMKKPRGWKIILRNSTTSLEIANTTTNNTGFYNFTNLVNGTYNVTEELQPGWMNVTPLSQQIFVSGQDRPNVNFTNQLIPV